MKLTSAKILARKYFVSRSCSVFNSLPASGDLCHLLITFTNSLDPDQNVGPDLDPKLFDSIEKNPAFKELNMAQL